MPSPSPTLLASAIASVFHGSARSGGLGAAELVTVGILARGHVLIEDLPGVGKTTLAKATARALGGDFRRIQGTPDLMPGDITGVSVWDERERAFRFHPGPVFSAVLLADELNRAPPRTQSALLEAMAESAVTIDGQARPLPEGFLCLATQNPLDQAGTYPLPESQRDRFLLRFSLGHPDRAHEAAVLRSDGADRALAALAPVADPAQLTLWRRETAAIAISDEVLDHLLAIIAATRSHRDLVQGASTRAALGWQRAAQGLARLRGRAFVTPDDLHALAEPALAHRLIARPGASPAQVIDDLLTRTSVPR